MKWSFKNFFYATTITLGIMFGVQQAITQSIPGGGGIGGAGGGGSSYTNLFQDGANGLEERNGVNAQTFRIYNTFTDASNYERGVFQWTTNVLEIGAQFAGTGSTRQLKLFAGSTFQAQLRLDSVTGVVLDWNNDSIITLDGGGVNVKGKILAATDNLYDIGASGATRPKDVYIAGRLASNRKEAITVDGATTFAITSGYISLACTGAETINTITGGITGMELIIEHTDTDCTIADDEDPTAANAIDLTGAASDVGAVGKVIRLLYNGTHWLQTGESDN